MSNQAKNTETKEFENRTVAYAYDVPAFGKGALKGQKGAAFVTNPLTAEQAEILKSKAGAGQQFALYRSPNTNAKGNYTYFFEFLPVRNLEADDSI